MKSEYVGKWFFWSYDQYPYVLCGRVQREKPEGDYAGVKCFILDCGQLQFSTKSMPVMLEHAEGKRFAAEIERLRSEHRQAKEELHTRFMKEAHKTLPFLKKLCTADGRRKN